MNYDALVSQGSAPWLPKGAEERDVLHMHDIPLIGLFDQVGAAVLYVCVSGATSRANVWAYLPLDEELEEAIEEFDCDSTAELEKFLHGLFIDRTAVFALALDGAVQTWSPGEVDQSGLLEAVISFMDMAMEPTAVRQAEQARADATLRVLEPA